MFEIVLYQPEIPPNTGNILRLCANTGARLNLVKPLGFQLTDRHLARAGMDYAGQVDVRIYDHWQACLEGLGSARIFALTTRGGTRHDRALFQAGDALVFGPETRGLPKNVLDPLPAENRLRVPMLPGSRSMNLSNAVAVVLYEAWRQCGFAGGE
ncbi:MAG: tRNA (cytidine(34)-2'-O)-methyltransferase [Rhodocyclaceae bacterium]